MSLSSKLAGNFTKNVRKRGDDYYCKGRVMIHEGSQSELTACVRGSGFYEVQFAWRNNKLAVWCDCPHFVEQGVPCKHVWATTLAADQHQYLTAAASADKLILDLDALGADGLDGGDYYDGDEELYEEDGTAPVLSSRSPAVVWNPAKPQPPDWRKQLGEVFPPRDRATWPSKMEILYVVDVAKNMHGGGLVLSLQSRNQNANGSFSRPKVLSMSQGQIAQLPLSEDREILSALPGGQSYSYGYAGTYLPIPESALLSPALARMLMPLVARTGRCFLRPLNEADNLLPLAWDEGGPWNFLLELHRLGETACTLVGFFERGEERRETTFPALATGGLVITRDRVAPLVRDTSTEWIIALRKQGSISVSEKERDEFLATLLCCPNLPPLRVPEELRYEEVVLPAHPHLTISKARVPCQHERLDAKLCFAYEGHMFAAFDPARGFFDAAGRRFIRRDSNAEKAAFAFLDQLGLKQRAPTYPDSTPRWELAPSKLPRIVRSLVEAGWDIEAEGKIFRRPGAFRIEVSSGVDWFELHGEVGYGNTTARLLELLEALRRGDKMVRLDDGTYGVLPEEWLRRIAPLAGMGEPEQGHMRFRQSQAGLLDALVAAQPEASCDETFARVREELQRFHSVEPAAQPAGFVGRLRDYQSEGLGWMHFLQRFSFGGCLADDMGVGKTAQVLALLESRRELRAAGEPVGPSLVVVPKSLVFNWKEEAARFTPQLRVLDHTGLERNGNDFAAYDLVLTTYGTLRRDAWRFKDAEFDYVVLDEAQVVKNAETESSKAARLLRGRYRLAVSGTPVENHLGELWTLFEFLNPGMLGAANAFKVSGRSMRNPDEETRRLLGQALRPFVLRRTKEQVARELPSKTEQTVYCVLEPEQRKLYDELRQHYRDSLLRRIEAAGLAKSKIQVLEALLRLRQAACHPGLLDSKRSSDSSAKLDVLLEQLREVLDEGHKALVFSQFTSLLKILRARLNRDGIFYEYLDGATGDRQTRVERFQNDKDCRLFLISLKAGGLGLNLTAAEYVFILDPWWNPAVEAQAVDRAHRIGQTRPIFTYRLIARDTVEEKVLELQKTKRDLAAAIIGAENSMIRDLRSEDLELLLS
ncbi:MAG: helicase SNF2 [Acidobacteria bacterium]|nr:MAG: helicase SNF2 [Acidobacteriota bacterium]PYU76433.1 MAG: helicase SNF2 [Acidobacteriota bacterium]